MLVKRSPGTDNHRKIVESTFRPPRNLYKLTVSRFGAIKTEENRWRISRRRWYMTTTTGTWRKNIPGTGFADIWAMEIGDENILRRMNSLLTENSTLLSNIICKKILRWPLITIITNNIFYNLLKKITNMKFTKKCFPYIFRYFPHSYYHKGGWSQFQILHLIQLRCRHY